MYTCKELYPSWTIKENLNIQNKIFGANIDITEIEQNKVIRYKYIIKNQVSYVPYIHY